MPSCFASTDTDTESKYCFYSIDMATRLREGDERVKSQTFSEVPDIYIFGT